MSATDSQEVLGQVRRALAEANRLSNWSGPISVGPIVTKDGADRLIVSTDRGPYRLTVERAPLTRTNLSRYRLRAGLSQCELADRLGVTSGTVELWESGQRGTTLNTSLRLAKILGVKVEDIFAADEPEVEESEAA